jgi:hypothetical protein
MKTLLFIYSAGLCLCFAGCCRQTPENCPEASASSCAASVSWKDELKQTLPLLGHRNWIVVTDMAYPLQNRPGIKTVYTGAPYMEVLAFVCSEIAEAPHIKPFVYQDKELSYLSEADVAGIDALRSGMTKLLGDRVIPIAHDKLIARLDKVSEMFTVVILKCDLTMPYTSTFLELDCKYWEGVKETFLRECMAAGE